MRKRVPSPQSEHAGACALVAAAALTVENLSPPELEEDWRRRYAHKVANKQKIPHLQLMNGTPRSGSAALPF